MHFVNLYINASTMKMIFKRTQICPKRFFCLCLISLLFGLSAYALPDYTLLKYKVENGLNHNTAYCILQDSCGLIWIGTGNGLNSFDGRTFRTYYIHNSTVSSNRILSLAELDAKTLIVGTNSGICLYDKLKDVLEPLRVNTEYGVSISCEVNRIAKDKNGNFWIATLGQGLFMWNPATNTLTQNSSYSSFIVDLSVSGETVYVATLQDGCAALNLDGTCKYKQTVAIEDATLSSLLVTPNTLWIGTTDGDIASFHTSDGSIKSQFSLLEEREEAILCFWMLANNRLLIGSSDGAYLLDTLTGRIETADSLVGERIVGNQLNAILQDNERGLWMATEQDGVNYLAWHTRHFERFGYEQNADNEKRDSGIGPLCEDNAGGIWVGNRYGLWRLGKNENLLKRVPLAANKEIEVTALLQTKDKLWIGTNGNGLGVMDLSSGSTHWYRHSQQKPNTIGSDVVLSLHQTRDGDIYVGTSWGLCHYTPQTDDFLTVTTVGMMVEVLDLHEDAYGYLWVATANSGVFRCFLKRGEWKHFQASADGKGLSINSVIALLESKNGKMWFATDGGGLCYYNRDTEDFSRLGAATSLPVPNVIYSMQEDAGGNLWLSSYWGLTRIDPANLQQTVYTVSDGLQSNQFCRRSSLLTQEGWLFFGNIGGLSACRPESFRKNLYVPPVIISDVSFSYLADPSQANLLKGSGGSFIELKRIEIPWNNNSFGLSFAALSYSDPSRNRYSYILHGIDREWIRTTDQTTAYYTDLPPGEYEFEVKGCNNNGIWSKESRRLTIVITPPWWLSIWAYTFYICLCGLLIGLLAWKWNLWVKQKYQKRMEQFRIMQEKETYRSKVGFFVNLVHEIRTPLSLINLPLEQLIEHRNLKEEDGIKYLETIRRNVDYLLGVTNELLDFQKMENEDLTFGLHPCNIAKLVHGIAGQFSESCRLNGKELETILPEKEVHAMTDIGKLSKVLVNFLSNAMKYAHHRIRLELTYDDEMFHLSVSDDGPGIEPEEHSRIFTAFYQVNNEHQRPGTGIGLAFSRTLAEGLNGKLQLTKSEWGGSCFTLSLPMGEVIRMEETGIEAIINEKENIPENAELNGRKFTILLVEDNQELLTMTAGMLNQWFIVQKAENGKKALELLKQDTVDVIVSDVMMPVMDGIELCRQVKSNIDWSHIPIILLTAKTSLEAKTEGIECGADVYVEKPFTIRQLKGQIENLLNLRKSYYKMMQHLGIGNGTKEPTEYVNNVLSQRDCELINKIKTIIEERMAEPDFSVDMLADALNMSRSNFYRKIKALSGMAPNDYLRIVRLNRAAKLLKQGLRITEVYEQTGFNTASYFTKCFKEYFGTLPKDYVDKKV